MSATCFMCGEEPIIPAGIDKFSKSDKKELSLQLLNFQKFCQTLQIPSEIWDTFDFSRHFPHCSSLLLKSSTSTSTSTCCGGELLLAKFALFCETKTEIESQVLTLQKELCAKLQKLDNVLKSMEEIVGKVRVNVNVKANPGPRGVGKITPIKKKQGQELMSESPAPEVELIQRLRRHLLNAKPGSLVRAFTNVQDSKLKQNKDAKMAQRLADNYPNDYVTNYEFCDGNDADNGSIDIDISSVKEEPVDFEELIEASGGGNFIHLQESTPYHEMDLDPEDFMLHPEEYPDTKMNNGNKDDQKKKNIKKIKMPTLRKSPPVTRPKKPTARKINQNCSDKDRPGSSRQPSKKYSRIVMSESEEESESGDNTTRNSGDDSKDFKPSFEFIDSDDSMSSSSGDSDSEQDDNCSRNDDETEGPKKRKRTTKEMRIRKERAAAKIKKAALRLTPYLEDIEITSEGKLIYHGTPIVESSSCGCRVCGLCQDQDQHCMHTQTLLYDVRIHIDRDHIGGFACKICPADISKLMPTEKSFVQHNLRHDVGIAFCEICGKPAKKYRSMKAHLWTHKSEEEKQMEISSGAKPPQITPRSKNRVKCDQCGSSFSQKGNLLKHIEVHHTTKEEREKNKVPCPTCGKMYSAMTIRSHVRFVHEKLSVRGHCCKDCPKSYQTAPALRTHVLRAHIKENKFMCQICSKCFTNPASLNCHVKIHTAGKDFECDICGLKYKRRAHLNRHIKKTHNADGSDQNCY